MKVGTRGGSWASREDIFPVDAKVYRELDAWILSLSKQEKCVIIDTKDYHPGLLFLSARFADFQRKYRELLNEIVARNLPTGVCTIYYPRFEEPELQSVACTALSLFNDCIIREAVVRRVPLLDLRIICNEDRDYANPIEPSEHGGVKIAKAITQLVLEHDFVRRRTQVFV